MFPGVPRGSQVFFRDIRRYSGISSGTQELKGIYRDFRGFSWIPRGSQIFSNIFGDFLIFLNFGISGFCSKFSGDSGDSGDFQGIFGIFGFNPSSLANTVILKEHPKDDSAAVGGH